MYKRKNSKGQPRGKDKGGRNEDNDMAMEVDVLEREGKGELRAGSLGRCLQYGDDDSGDKEVVAGLKVGQS